MFEKYTKNNWWQETSLFLILEEPFSIMWTLVCHRGFYEIERETFYTYLLQDFCLERTMDFVKYFSVSIEMVIWSLSFLLFMWCFICIHLHMFNHSCIPGIQCISSWYVIFLLICCILLSRMMFDDLANIFTKKISL